MSTGLQEGEIKAALRSGGSIRGAFFVARRESYGFEFQVYLRPSWGRPYMPLRTFGGKADRTYRDVGRLLQLVCEDFKFIGSITIYKAKSPELARFRGLQPCDMPDHLEGAAAEQEPDSDQAPEPD